MTAQHCDEKKKSAITEKSLSILYHIKFKLYDDRE